MKSFNIATQNHDIANLRIFALIVFIATISHSKSQTTEDHVSIADKDDFSWDLLKQGNGEKGINVVISPLSAKIELGVAVEATKDANKRQEIYDALTDSQELTSYDFRAYGKNAMLLTKNNNNIILRNRIYTSSAVRSSDDYIGTLREYYGVDVLQINFNNTRIATNSINSWCQNVMRKEEELKVTIVKERDLSQGNILLLSVNQFTHKLNSDFYTEKNYFYETPEQQIKVSYMEQTNTFFFLDSKTMDAKMLRLPLSHKLSITILLPNPIAGVEELLENLTNEQVKRMQSMMKKKRVKIALPAFSFTYNISFNQISDGLGVRGLFTENAGLTKLDPTNTGKISDMYQYSAIDINIEETGKFVPSEANCTEFFVNRPFIFFIEEEAFGNIVFAGKVLKPTTIK